MEEHDIIVTEEAPTPRFTDMLNKKIPIAEYIREEYLEFPKFSWRYYRLLRQLHYKGKQILQIEPYMERLFLIYEMFSDGKKPSDVLDIPVLKEVYTAEKKVTAALLDFYEHSLKSSFQEIVRAVMRFAGVDAERFRLRDMMRAGAIAKVFTGDKKVYVEAGGIHVFLERELRQKLRGITDVKALFLLEPFIRKISGKKEFLPPGDLLTIHYILDKRKNEHFETLQASRSLIYIIFLNKEEMIPSKTIEAPHIEDEIKINEFVSRLTVQQCEELYGKIHLQKREDALKALRI
jgi:hypothetical protein